MWAQSDDEVSEAILQIRTDSVEVSFVKGGKQGLNQDPVTILLSLKTELPMLTQTFMFAYKEKKGKQTAWHLST